MPFAIELRNISKQFGLVQANRNVSLMVESGTIHGIIGENGAGKSTLMSILYGFYQANSGTIHVQGHELKINNAHDAIASGIGMVHQHFMLVDNFTVLENVVLGVESGWTLKASLDDAREILLKLEKEYHLEVDVDALIQDLPVGLLQRVEILKALYRKADILILDEVDRMLDMGFIRDIRKVINLLPERRQNLLFSAVSCQLPITIPKGYRREGYVILI